LRSADPAEPPLVDYRYLTAPGDAERLRHGVRLAADLLASPALAALDAGGHAARPDRRTLADDTALDRWIAARLGTAVHLCASAPMGPDTDPRAVVDQDGRVRGVEGLRVADTSILPDAPSRPPNAVAIMLAEHLATTFG
jgi:choline dehydrogenase-like flavoprotein